jgi:hypothetical protein
MNIKKEVYARVCVKLQKEQADLRWQLEKNKRGMAAAVLEQTILKRQIAEYGSLLRDIQGERAKIHP